MSEKAERQNDGRIASNAFGEDLDPQETLAADDFISLPGISGIESGSYQDWIEWKDMVCHTARQAHALRDKLAEASADAARYRMLRAVLQGDKLVGEEGTPALHALRFMEHGLTDLTTDEIDAAVDALLQLEEDGK